MLLIEAVLQVEEAALVLRDVLKNTLSTLCQKLEVRLLSFLLATFLYLFCDCSLM